MQEKIRKNQLKEKHLREEYKQLRKSEEGIQDVKNYQVKEAAKQWLQLR